MKKHISVLLLSISLLALLVPSHVQAATATTPNLKVAFIGDSGEGSDFQNVLNLIKAEQAEIIFHQGDFSYTSGPTTWIHKVNTTVPNIIYLGSDGNHDDWADYAPFFQQQISKHQAALTVTGTVASGNYAVVYKGLKVANIQENEYTTFAKDQLQNADNIWKICAWHKNQAAMQVGGKKDERGWQLYEDCRTVGALIMTGHEHSYSRTKTLTNMTMQTVDASCSSITQSCVSPGRSVVFVSGLGGTGIRNQDRCLTGCKGEWAKIYTSDQGAKFGALFMIFNYQGNPNKAHGYFKNISGQIIDEFDITSGSGDTQPTTTAPPSGSNCAKKNIGDADCAVSPSGKTVDILDYAIWYSEFINGCSSTNLAGCGVDSDKNGNPMDANFNYPGTNYIVTDNKVDVFDYAVWIQGYTSQNPPAPTTTPTALLSPTLVPTTIPQPTGTAKGIWISATEVKARTASGPEWDAMLAIAQSASASGANIANQDSNHDIDTLAMALVCVNQNNAPMCTKARAAVVSAINTESGGRWLAVGRNLGSYIIAADLLQLYADGNPNSEGSKVQAWLTAFYTRTLPSNNNASIQHTWRQSAWSSGSNASAQEGFAYAALAAYLKNKEGLDWSWNGFRRYAGDRTSTHKISSNDTSWQFKPDDIVGIQDAGASKAGCRLDGAIANDMSRGGSYSCSPGYTSYPWVGLEGAVPAALVLHRAGYPAFSISSNAILRTNEYLWDVRQRTGNADWYDGTRANEIIHLVNVAYKKNFILNKPVAGNARTVDFTLWTHPSGI